LRGRHGHLLVKWESLDLGYKLGRALELFFSGEFLSLAHPKKKVCEGLYGFFGKILSKFARFGGKSCEVAIFGTLGSIWSPQHGGESRNLPPSTLTCSQIWLIPLVDDGHPPTSRNWKKNLKNHENSEKSARILGSCLNILHKIPPTIWVGYDIEWVSGRLGDHGNVHLKSDIICAPHPLATGNNFSVLTEKRS
jgi:hypothetical protein